MRVVLFIAWAAVCAVPPPARAQSGHDNERLAFSLAAHGYIQENGQPDQTGYGAGIGVLLGHGITPWATVLIAIDAGAVNNDA
jgi:hypothetical protein